MDKRGFFFTLDAVMALMIVGIGLFLVLSAYFFVPSVSRTEVISQDALTFLSTTTIENLNDPYAGIGGTLWDEGRITQPENTLLQQIGEFKARGDEATASLFITALLENIVPENYGLQVEVDGGSIYPLQAEQAEASQAGTDVLISKETIVYGISNTTTYDLWGPSVVRVKVWHG